MNDNPPTIYTEFEDDVLYGNREGFENLQRKIENLLTQGNDCITLYDDEDYEDCFTSLCIREPERSDADDGIGIFGVILILFLTIGVWLFGVGSIIYFLISISTF